MKRTHNEDYFSLLEDEQLFLVADGMGGHACGEVASKLATDAVADFYRHSKNVDATWPYRYDHDLSYVENRFITAIRSANSKIFSHAQSNPARRGMGTTLVGCLLVSKYAYVAHVGDSRCYRVRKGEVTLLTRDHSLLEDYKDARPDMTEAEARNFPHKNVITRALGMRESVTVDLSKFEVESGDRFVLCSDGLSSLLADHEILSVTAESDDLESGVDRLIDEANQAGGTDNITAMVVECTY